MTKDKLVRTDEFNKRYKLLGVIRLKFEIYQLTFSSQLFLNELANDFALIGKEH